MDKELPTTDFLNVLDKVSDKSSLDIYISNLGEPISKKSFFSNYIGSHSISMKEITKKCTGLISKSYMYEILNGIKINPSRDMLLILCIACHMNSKDTRRALSTYELPSLYPKAPRDAIILTCINNKNFDFEYINDTLESYGLDLLPSQSSYNNE